ncbi:MAG TPA: hypothetical protein DDY78_30195, partial [Planctomycetales bacterium]|nr:hypothetical protein [Planctomycetales bacterium]
MPSWHFMTLRPGDTTREPIQGEFFATEAINNSATALVREGIQNSLDAPRNGQLRVEIRVSGTERAAAAKAAEPFLDGAWPHLEAKPNGLRDVPSPQDPCQFLTFEDFGTVGLEGDPEQWHIEDGVENGFFNFFRADGHSDKSETDRGRWGVGKTVFPRSSRISTFWGVTVRASNARRLLMGRAILKSHQIGGTRYVPDGYFGDQGADQLTLPVQDADTIERFCQVFGLRRGAEPGLSLVVPCYAADELTAENLLHAVVEGYFHPILGGDLQVAVTGPDGAPQQLTADTLVETVRRLNGTLATDMLPLLELAVWARDVVKEPIPTLNRPPAQKAPKWSADLVPPDMLRQFRQKLHAGERIAVRVPMPVREKGKGKETKWSFFDVFLVRDGTEERPRPLYIREGITITGVRGKTTRGISALVVVVDRPLATLLGDSENISHTEWQKEGSNYKDKYVFGPANLEFVSNSVAEIVRLVSETEEEADPAILIDLFSLPAEPDSPGAVRTRQKRPGPDQPGP